VVDGCRMDAGVRDALRALVLTILDKTFGERVFPPPCGLQ
jgi:hypothetical protein